VVAFRIPEEKKPHIIAETLVKGKTMPTGLRCA